jgi:hypothetical protein
MACQVFLREMAVKSANFHCDRYNGVNGAAYLRHTTRWLFGTLKREKNGVAHLQTNSK